MIAESSMNEAYWAEEVNTACYTKNRAMINKALDKTLFEIYRGKKPNMSNFRGFDCKCYVLNNGKDQLRAFQAKSDEGVFLGYSDTSEAFRIINKRTLVVEESIHVVFDENIEQFAGHDEIVERIEKLTLLDESDVRDIPPIPIVQMDENLEENIHESTPDTQPATNTQAATDGSQTFADPNDTRAYKR